MTTDPRTLIAEGRKHDEAMTPKPWYGRSRFVSRVPDNTGMGATLHTNHIANTADQEDARGIAWLRTNLASLLEGYASAMDEMDGWRRKAEVALKLFGETQTELVTARTALGELKLVIEQQDRDATTLYEQCDSWRTQAQQLAARITQQDAELESSRAMNRHYEQERDSWPEAYKQRAAQTDARIKELEAGLREAIESATMATLESLRKLLPSTGAP